ncbi:BCCT family transporter [Solimicrobium silvestre]|uniref:Bcct: transporter, betaine/carnitine/choline transporter (BCCT) family n=1 Tax=Solimicrobium silvestre TaxID=2099400 RepID=A0A2S9H5F6_9BURK|nr:BCCT family transporter [Solimicrobium silvestre]PRC95220.1 bcct: transporter, betaine/carnitine/choline transporter (BCCT) family [Solimicrobium silvestre]
MPVNSPSKRTTFSWPVVIPSLVFVSLLVVISIINPSAAEHWFASAQSWVTFNFSWFYTLLVAFFLMLLIGIAMSKYGAIRLGPDDAEPEFPFTSWMAMLFAAGMGVGLMYFGVGEPLQHYLTPPLAAGGTPAGAREAMSMTFFHWGFHAWAIYGVVGLVLAYFGFRYNLPLTIRSGLYPILKERINGPWGHAVDVFALCSTIFGIATTVGYGVKQLSAGLGNMTGWHTGDLSFQLGLIVVVVVLAGISAASGLGKGLRILSEINLLIAIVLMGFVLAVGPTLYLLGSFSENLGDYLSSIVEMTFRNYTYEPTKSAGWFGNWTILYWAWWISWSPFVGMFIARISRGRTIREFIVGVLLVPSLFNFMWMTVFGNSAIWIDTHVAAGALGATASNVDALLFQFFSYLPFSALSSIVAVLLIAVFFVTSADSGAFVIDNIASRGNTNSPIWQRLFWAALIGLVACCLLSAGGLKALQAMTLIAALPFGFVMLLLCVGLLRGLQADALHSQQKLSYASNFWTGKHWKRRLAQILHQAGQVETQTFMNEMVQPAMRTMQQEFAKGAVQAEVMVNGDGSVQLKIAQTSLRDFVYGVRCVAKEIPAFALNNDALPASSNAQTYEPTTYFADGRKGYDIQYFSEEELLADILKQYERHLSLSMNAQAQLLQQAPSHQ